MTVRVQCHACACVFAMPRGLRPTELSAWMGWHACECQIDARRDLTVLAAEDSTYEMEVSEVTFDSIRVAVAAVRRTDDAFIAEARELLTRACALRDALEGNACLKTLLAMGVNVDPSDLAQRQGSRAFYEELARWLAPRIAARTLRGRPVDVGDLAEQPASLAPRVPRKDICDCDSPEPLGDSGLCEKCGGECNEGIDDDDAR